MITTLQLKEAIESALMEASFGTVDKYLQIYKDRLLKKFLTSKSFKEIFSQIVMWVVDEKGKKTLKMRAILKEPISDKTFNSLAKAYTKILDQTWELSKHNIFKNIKLDMQWSLIEPVNGRIEQHILSVSEKEAEKVDDELQKDKKALKSLGELKDTVKVFLKYAEKEDAKSVGRFDTSILIDFNNMKKTATDIVRRAEELEATINKKLSEA